MLHAILKFLSYPLSTVQTLLPSLTIYLITTAFHVPPRPIQILKFSLLMSEFHKVFTGTSSFCTLHFTTVSRNPLVWIELYAIRGRYSGLHSSRQNLQLPTCIPGRMSQCSSHLATPQFTVSKPCQIWCHRRQSPEAYHEGWYSISFWSTSHSIFNCEESWRSARQHVFHGSTCCWRLEELLFSYTRIAPCESISAWWRCTNCCV